MADNASFETDRRTFMKQAAGTVLAAGMDARSYARVLGANDRIRLAQLGCGGRSHGHVHMVQLASKEIPVETVAVCDIWSLAREQRAAQLKEAFNLDPQSYKYSEELLARQALYRGGEGRQGLLRRKALRQRAVRSHRRPQYCEGLEAGGSDGVAAS